MIWRTLWTLTAIAAVAGLLLIAGQLHVANCQADHRENCGMISNGDPVPKSARVYCWTREVKVDNDDLFGDDTQRVTAGCTGLP